MQRVPKLRWIPWLLVGLIAVTGVGCINGIANVIAAIKGEKIAPAYSGLKGKKVAIVCGGERGLSNDATSALLTRYLEVLLSTNVEEIKIVSQDKVDKWLDERGWNEPDYEAIGKGVGADQVVAITLANVSLRNGQTLYKGRADISVSVYDVNQDGKVVYRQVLPEFEFPTSDGAPVIDTTEAKFRVKFLSIVSKHIGVLFYPHDPKELAVLDPLAMR